MSFLVEKSLSPSRIVQIGVSHPRISDPKYDIPGKSSSPSLSRKQLSIEGSHIELLWTHDRPDKFWSIRHHQPSALLYDRYLTVDFMNSPMSLSYIVFPEKLWKMS